MLLEFTPDPFSRDQFTPGHITCTGLVLSARRRARSSSSITAASTAGCSREATSSPRTREIGDAARREVIEETGVGARTRTRPAP